MTKFSQNFKLRVVLGYFKCGIGSKSLCHKYGIKSHSNIQNWIHQYEVYDFEGLVFRHSERDYPGNYKVKVLNWRYIRIMNFIPEQHFTLMYQTPLPSVPEN